VAAAIPQELLFTALRATHNPLVWVDRDGVVIFINELAQELLGAVEIGGRLSEYARTHEILRPDGTVYAPLDRPFARAALRGERVTNERCKIRRPDGRVVEVLATASPLLDATGAQIGALLTMRDITEQQLLEQWLRRSEQRFGALVRATGQLIWCTDATGSVQEDSPSWRAFTGQTRSQWLGDGWLYVVHPDDRDTAERAWRAAVASRSLYQTRYRLRRHDSVYRWTLARGAPTLDERGGVIEWIGCTWDIDEPGLDASGPLPREG